MYIEPTISAEYSSAKVLVSDEAGNAEIGFDSRVAQVQDSKLKYFLQLEIYCRFFKFQIGRNQNNFFIRFWEGLRFSSASQKILKIMLLSVFLCMSKKDRVKKVWYSLRINFYY